MSSDRETITKMLALIINGFLKKLCPLLVPKLYFFVGLGVTAIGMVNLSLTVILKRFTNYYQSINHAKVFIYFFPVNFLSDEYGSFLLCVGQHHFFMDLLINLSSAVAQGLPKTKTWN